MSFLEELLANTDREKGHDLSDIQVVSRLREVFALRSEVETFAPGQVIRHKWPELANTKSAGKPVIFVEYIDPVNVRDMVNLTDPSEVYSASTAQTIDCKVMCLSSVAAAVFFANSHEYAAHPDFPN